MKAFFLRALPHIVAIALFVGISSAFFSPVFDGYTLRQGDIENYMGMSKEARDYRDVFGEEALWTNSMFGGMPAYQISVVHSANLLKHVDRLMSLYLPRPIDTMFLAMLGFYILLLCLRINPWVAIPGAIVFGLGSVNVLYLSAGHTAKIKALAYMAPTLGGLYLTFRGRIIAGLSVTALFLGLHLSANHLQMSYYLFFLLLAAAIGEGIRLILNAEFGKLAKASAALALAGLLGVLPTMSNLLTTYEYSKYSTRGKTELTLSAEDDVRPEQGLDQSYILEYSMSRAEFLSIIIPDIKGGAAGQLGNDRQLLKNVEQDFREPVGQQNRYWGEQRFSGGAFYFGAAMFVLFLLGMILLKDPAFKWSLFVLAVLAVMLSWKEPNGIGQMFLDKVPMYSQFRDTKMILVLLMIIIPLIGMRYLNDLIYGEKSKLKPVLIGSGALLVVMLLFAAKPATFFDFMSNDEKSFFAEYLENDQIDAAQSEFVMGIMDRVELLRQDILRADVLRSIFFMVLVIALVVLAALKKLKMQVLVPALGLIMLVDLWMVDRRYLDTENIRKNSKWKESWMALHPFDASNADSGILEKIVLENPAIAEKIDAAVKSASLPQGKQQSAQRSRMEAEIAFRELNFNSNFRVLNFGNPFNEAGTSFFHKSIGGYHGAKLKRYQELVEIHLQKELGDFSQMAQTAGLDLAFSQSNMLNMLNTRFVIADPQREAFENPYALGNAWFVDSVIWAGDADDEMQKLGNINPATTVVIDERFKDLIKNVSPADSMASVNMDSYLPNHLSYTSNSVSGGLIVFSEIHYPEGWNAYVDGNPAEYARVNYLLRAIKVDGGSHKIEFKFEPHSFSSGSTVSLAGSVLLLLLCAGSLFMWYRSGKKQESEA